MHLYQKWVQETNTTKLMFANRNWVTVTNPLQAATSVISLPKEEITLGLYTGTLGAGNYTISAKYQIGDKVVEATSVLNIVTKTYADAYTSAQTQGKSDSYAANYAAATDKSTKLIESIGEEKYGNEKIGAYASTYAKVKETGAPENFAARAATSTVIIASTVNYTKKYPDSANTLDVQQLARAFFGLGKGTSLIARLTPTP